MWDADKIKAMRKQHGMTQEELAEIMGISVHTLRYWEQGQGAVPMIADKFLTILVERFEEEDAAKNELVA